MRTILFLASLSIAACDDPTFTGPGGRRQGTPVDPTMAGTVLGTVPADPPATEARGARIDHGEVVFDHGDCSGVENAVYVPPGAVVEWLVCDDKVDGRRRCNRVSDQFPVRSYGGDGDEVYLLACTPSAFYRLLWIAPAE